LPNTQAFAATKKTKNHQKSLFFKNQALYGQTKLKGANFKYPIIS